MSNNLRIIYQNIIDSTSTTITASSTASANTTVANLKADTKSKVWRSTGKELETLTISFTSSIVGGLILPFCNLSPVATISVTGSLAGVVKFTDVDIPACPYPAFGLWDWGMQPLGVNSYSYGGGTYGRVWFSTGNTALDSIVITIKDPSNSSSYIEASRIILGAYWSPIYNTSFGLSTTIKDLSEHQRTESGDLATNRGIRFNTMTFDLKYLTQGDRLNLTGILKGNGIPKPLFISLFPNDADSTKEQSHQIYGKLSQLAGISNPIFDMYSSSIDIEEI